MSENLIVASFDYQNLHEESVVLIYDPVKVYAFVSCFDEPRDVLINKRFFFFFYSHRLRKGRCLSRRFG